MKRTNEIFVKKVKELMRKKRYSTYKLSVMSAIPNSTIHNILKGNTKNPGLDSIINICRGLDVPLMEFFGDDVFSFENLPDD